MSQLQYCAVICSLSAAAFASFLNTGAVATNLKSTTNEFETVKTEAPMPLGNFSVSLAVKDIEASKAFYEKLDFKPVGGEVKQNWLIMQNGTTTIGLFQGLFEKNIMTFNPGWDKDQNTLDEFEDVRELQKKLKKRGIKLVTEADESTDGAASFVIADPDGNSIMFDQHVSAPKKTE